jgi:hypothetical protein
LADFGLLVRAQTLKDWQTTILVDLTDEVGSVVGLHPRQQSRRVYVRASFEEFQLVLDIELLEDVGLEFAVQTNGFNDLLTLFVARLLDEVGNLGGMKFGQFAIGNSKSRGRHVRDKGLDRRKVNNRLRLHALTNALSKDPTQEWSTTGVDTHNLPLAVDLGNLDVVRRDETTADQVYEVSCQQVFRQQQFTGATLESTKIDALALEGHAALGQSTDLANWNEEVATLDTNDGSNNRWMGVVPEARDEVLDATNPVAVRIEDWSVQERGEVEKISHLLPLMVLSGYPLRANRPFRGK